MQLLQASELVKIYGRRSVVDKVSFEVNTGEIVGLLGPNGAGKTTSFLMTIGMVKPNGGRIDFKGKETTQLPIYKRARLGMGYLSQEPSIFRKLSVEENILSILETMKLPRRQRKVRLEELLDELDLTRLRRNRADSLSGGERRRLEITRVLVTRPSLILLDEPFSGVDPIAIAEVQDIVRGLRSRGIGVLLTDHNVRETLSITDRSYIIADGHIIRQGSAEELIQDPTVRKVYLGDRFSMPERGFRPDMPGLSEEIDSITLGEDRMAPVADDGISADEVGLLDGSIQEEEEKAAEASDPPAKGKAGKPPKKEKEKHP